MVFAVLASSPLWHGTPQIMSSHGNLARQDHLSEIQNRGTYLPLDSLISWLKLAGMRDSTESSKYGCTGNGPTWCPSYHPYHRWIGLLISYFQSVHTLLDQTDNTLHYLANMNNVTEFYHDLSHVMRPRIPGTTGHKQVANVSSFRVTIRFIV